MEDIATTEPTTEVDQGAYLDNLNYNGDQEVGSQPTTDVDKPVVDVQPGGTIAIPEGTDPVIDPNAVVDPSAAPVVAEPDFITDMFGEGGELDVNKYMTSQSLETQPLNIANPLDAQAGQVAPEPEKTAKEQVLEYRKNISDNMFTGLNLTQEYINRGYDAATAIQLATNDINGNIQDHMSDYMLERQTDSMGVAEKSYAEKVEAAQLEPRSTTNINRVAQEFGYKSVQSFKDALFHKDYGGQAINFLFDQANPNWKEDFKGNQQGLTDSFNNFFTKFTANETNTQYLANQVKMIATQKLNPQLIKQVRGQTQAQELAKGGSTTIKPNSKNLSPDAPKPDALDDWLKNDSRIDDF